MANFSEADATALFSAVKSLPMSLAVFDAIGTHEPENAPGKGINLSITLGPITTAPSGLSSTSLTIRFIARVYSSLTGVRPLDPVDAKLLGAACALMGAWSGSFTLGGRARNADLIAASMNPGYLNQDGKEFRVMTLDLPVIINDAFDQEA